MKIRTFLLWFALLGVVFAQSAVLMPIPEQQFFTLGGLPNSNGFIYTYSTGTNTPLATFTDSTATVQNSNPIILNAGGFPTCSTVQCGIWLQGGAIYRIIVQNSAHVQQYSIDGIGGTITAAYRSTTDQTSTSAADVHTLATIPVVAGQSYAFDCSAGWSSTDSGTSAVYNLVFPANNFVTTNLRLPYAETASHVTAELIQVTSFSSSTSTVNPGQTSGITTGFFFPMHMTGTFTNTTAGNVLFTFAANASHSVTTKAGANCVLTPTGN